MKSRRISLWKLLVALLCAQLPLVAAVAGAAQPTIFSEPSQTVRYTLPDDGVSSDSLFRHYVEQCFEAALPGHAVPAPKTGTRSGLDELSGNDAKLVKALMPRIRAIADGTVSSGVITIPASEILDCNAYTAAQLGVSAIVADGAFTSEVAAKMSALCDIDLGNILRVLLTDMPYELYWFDKATGLSYSLPGYSGNSNSVHFNSNQNYTFYFYVAKEYSATDAVETTDLGPIPSVVSAAVTRAQSVVEGAPDGTPVQKMEYYYNWISDNVSYNNDAANMSPVIYGNPWQLIWAFDDNPDTNIVCEGYSKAFKYLCDLSGFQDIECLLVTGNLGSVSGGVQGPPGPHMWNVVRMDDGCNYLVDVTNGRKFYDQLFMYYRIDWSQYGFSQYNDGYASGYHLVYNYDGSSISFTYDDETKTTFGEQALTLSTHAYEGPAAKRVTLSESSDIASQLAAYAGLSGVHVNYRRTGLVVGQPATVCLPFAFPLPQISVGTFYTLGSVTVNEDTGLWEASMTVFTGSTLSANTPYIFKPTFGTVDFSGDYTIPAGVSAGSQTAGKWSLTGTYTQKTWTAAGTDYGFSATDGRDGDGNSMTAGTFVRCNAGASCAPLRCYLHFSGAAGTRAIGGQLPEMITVRFLDGNGETTGIGELNTVTGEWTDQGWYDLSGRRLSGEPVRHGIYIHNGKKVKR